MSDSFPAIWVVPEQAIEILQMLVVTLNARVGDGKKGTDASLARSLSGYLDGYNNGLVCVGSE